MAAVDCTINDLLNKLDEWTPLWFGDVDSNTGDTVAIPLEYKQICGMVKINSSGEVQFYGPNALENSIDWVEQRLDYVQTIYGCRIYRIVGISQYKDNFMMIFGKLTDKSTKNL